jgi:hypothetical protein
MQLSEGKEKFCRPWKIMSKHSEKRHCVKCEGCLLGQRVSHKENALWIPTGALNAKDTTAITERSRGVTLAIDICNTNWGKLVSAFMEGDYRQGSVSLQISPKRTSSPKTMRSLYTHRGGWCSKTSDYEHMVVDSRSRQVPWHKTSSWKSTTSENWHSFSLASSDRERITIASPVLSHLSSTYAIINSWCIHTFLRLLAKLAHCLFLCVHLHDNVSEGCLEHILSWLQLD